MTNIMVCQAGEINKINCPQPVGFAQNVAKVTVVAISQWPAG